jgi:hypothetical protein
MLRCSRTVPNLRRTDGVLKQVRINEACGRTPTAAAAERLRGTRARDTRHETQATRAFIGLITTAPGHTTVLPTAAAGVAADHRVEPVRQAQIQRAGSLNISS